LPLAQIATAIPRRRTHHSDVSAMSGANIEALPRTPISTPWASMKLHRLWVVPATAKPPPMPAAPIRRGTITP
jgi:hypothetical protein